MRNILTTLNRHVEVYAHDLRQGDLLHLGGSSYVLVHHADPVDGRVRVTIYATETEPAPFRSYPADEVVRLSLQSPSLREPQP